MRKTVLPIVLLALAWPAAASQAGYSPTSTLTSVSWDQIEEIEKTICVLSTQVEGREYLAPVAGFRKQCGQPDAATPVGRAVDHAFEEGGTIIRSLSGGSHIRPWNSVFRSVEQFLRTRPARDEEAREGLDFSFLGGPARGQMRAFFHGR